MRNDAGRAMLVALVMTAGLSVACETPPPAAAPPPIEVYVTDVVQKDVPVYLDLVGQTEGRRTWKSARGRFPVSQLPRGLLVRKGARC